MIYLDSSVALLHLFTEGAHALQADLTYFVVFLAGLIALGGEQKASKLSGDARWGDRLRSWALSLVQSRF
jgi:hypothetical protein